MKIVEIFKSIEGEGMHTGKSTVFVRLAGCNLGCKWCDTKYSHDVKFPKVHIGLIYARIMRFEPTHITLTGGEPLLQAKELRELVRMFPDDISINLETNGSYQIPDWYLERENSTVTVDYKCASSGENGSMVVQDRLRPQDVIKIVTGQDDLHEMQDMVRFFLKRYPCTIFISPLFGDVKLDQLAEVVVSMNEPRVRLGLQIHKIIWDPERRGV